MFSEVDFREREKDMSTSMAADNNNNNSSHHHHESECSERFDINVLVVDDDAATLSIVAGILRSWEFYKVATATNGHEALKILREFSGLFDLVITDLYMQGMSGFELQKQVKLEFNLPVIMMSSDKRKSVMSKSLANGASFYIVKPARRDDFKDIWQYAVAGRKEKFIVTTNNNNNNNVHPQSLVTISNDNINEGGGGSPSNNSPVPPSPLSQAQDGNNNSNDGAASNHGLVVRDQPARRRRKYCKRKGGSDDTNNNNIIVENHHLLHVIDNNDDTTIDYHMGKKPKVVWSTSLHNRFLLAIRQIGLNKAVPKRILEIMNVPGLTRENVASHLQKYRIFLRKVAERGIIEGLSDRALRSRFASGLPLSLIKPRRYIPSLSSPPPSLITTQVRLGQQHHYNNNNIFRHHPHPLLPPYNTNINNNNNVNNNNNNGSIVGGFMTSANALIPANNANSPPNYGINNNNNSNNYTSLLQQNNPTAAVATTNLNASNNYFSGIMATSGGGSLMHGNNKNNSNVIVGYNMGGIEDNSFTGLGGGGSLFGNNNGTAAITTQNNGDVMMASPMALNHNVSADHNHHHHHHHHHMLHGSSTPQENISGLITPNINGNMNVNGMMMNNNGDNDQENHQFNANAFNVNQASHMLDDSLTDLFFMLDDMQLLDEQPQENRVASEPLNFDFQSPFNVEQCLQQFHGVVGDDHVVSTPTSESSIILQPNNSSTTTPAQPNPNKPLGDHVFAATLAPVGMSSLDKANSSARNPVAADLDWDVDLIESLFCGGDSN